MSSDERKPPSDTRFVHAGIGVFATFVCGKCEQKRMVTGRKLITKRGIRLWVCRGCQPQEGGVA